MPRPPQPTTTARNYGLAAQKITTPDSRGDRTQAFDRTAPSAQVLTLPGSGTHLVLILK